MSVVQLKQAIVDDDIVTGLRGLADRIERGEVTDGPISTCVVVLGHSTSKLIDGEVVSSTWHDTYGFGPRCEPYLIKGLLFQTAVKL